MNLILSLEPLKEYSCFFCCQLCTGFKVGIYYIPIAHIYTGCFTITVKSNFSSFMTFFDVQTIPMPFLCVPGWDIYVFSHESSETIKNIWFQSVCSVGWLFWAKKPFFLFLILIGPNHSEMVPNGKKTVRHHFWTIWDHF